MFLGFLLYKEDVVFLERLSQDRLQGVSDLGAGVLIPSNRWIRFFISSRLRRVNFSDSRHRTRRMNQNALLLENFTFQ